jgi:hypothetical protein
MKKFVHFSLIGLWILLVTILLASWWLHQPNIFPHVPDSFWIWLHDLFGVEDAETALDVAMLVVFTWSLCFVSFVTWLGLFLWNHLKNR